MAAAAADSAAEAAARAVAAAHLTRRARGRADWPQRGYAPLLRDIFTAGEGGSKWHRGFPLHTRATTTIKRFPRVSNATLRLASTARSTRLTYARGTASGL